MIFFISTFDIKNISVNFSSLINVVESPSDVEENVAALSMPYISDLNDLLYIKKNNFKLYK